MAVNPDAANRLKISFRKPREGSCLTPELLEELADLIDVQLPAGSTAGGNACVAADANNIASLDAQNCILVPKAILHTEEQTFDVTSGAALDFEDHAELGLDATACFFACNIFMDSAEAGKDVQGDPSGTENIRPNFEIVTFTAGKITITVKNASSDVRVRIQLLQVPVPPEQE